MKYISTLIAVMFIAVSVIAQITPAAPLETSRPKAKKRGGSISVGSGGISYKRGPDDTVIKDVSLQCGMLDVGINFMQDNTDYSSQAARDFLRVDGSSANADLFSQRNSKSINVNIYPVMLKALVYKRPRQKIILATGLGLQFYNFRYTKPISYRAEPTVGVVLDTILFTKNKLAFTYLTMPLLILGKTRLAQGKEKGRGNVWLTYSVGVSAGYRLTSWTKQISNQRGLDKNHNDFNFSNTNFCLNGELGIAGLIRFYASYQLTPLHTSALDQHPICIGVRFFGL